MYFSEDHPVIQQLKALAAPDEASGDFSFWLVVDDEDGEEDLCRCCATKERDRLLATGDVDEVRLAGNDIRESDNDMSCDHCGRRLFYIPTAYCIKDTFERYLDSDEISSLEQITPSIAYELHAALVTYTGEEKSYYGLTLEYMESNLMKLSALLSGVTLHTGKRAGLRM